MKLQQAEHWWTKLLTLGCLAVFCAACSGGSGSSGFDAKYAETAAITRALDEGRCVTPETRKPVICPSNVVMPRDGLGTVEVGAGPTDAVPCVSVNGAQCNLALPFMPEGLPASAVYRIAVRTLDPNSVWRIGAAPQPNGSPSMPDFDGTVSVDVPRQSPTPGQAGQPVRVQFAVLVYLAPPANLPSEVEILAASGADFAYVTQSLTLQISS